MLTALLPFGPDGSVAKLTDHLRAFFFFLYRSSVFVTAAWTGTGGRSVRVAS